MNEIENNVENSVSFIPRVDPITFIFMIPFLPAMLIFQLQNLAMQQMSQSVPNMNQKTKITSITRTGNTLDIIERWV